MKQIKPIIWGLAIIALGVIFGGNAIGLFNIDVFFDGWWTLFIIVPGVISLFTDKEKLSSLVIIGIGVILLLAARDVFSYDIAWKVILAVVLIAIGLGLVFRSIFHTNNDKEIGKKIEDLENGKIMDSQTAIFSGNERTYNKESFQGSNIIAVFGGVDLDLINAKFEKDTVIKAFCAFGGIDITIPEDVQIKVKSAFIFGGASDERKDVTAKGKHTIYIDAAGAFGGVTINSKKK